MDPVFVVFGIILILVVTGALVVDRVEGKKMLKDQRENGR